MKILKNDKKIFFFDIDGTLANGKVIPQSTQKALQILKQQGHLLFICTGRSYEYASHFFGDYVDGFITSNGRYIVYQDKVLLDKPLSSKQIQCLMKVIRKHHCGFAFIDHQHGYLENEDSDVLKEIIENYFPHYYLTDFLDQDVSGYIFDLYFSNHQQFKAVQKELAETVILNEHFPHLSADATVLGVDKGDGIDIILNYFNIDKANAYAFGDGSNDRCMFEHADHSIAMRNGIELLKEMAEYVTTSINDDGIYKALQYYTIID